MKLRADLPKYAQHLFQPRRYKVFYGGRGAGRSWTIARGLLILGAQKKLRILCAREYQKSIQDSVHRLLRDQIDMLEIPGYTVTNREITHAGTGTNFLFEGLKYNTNRIKSLEGVDICWVEEAESVSKDSWEILIPTIRKEGSEIWVSFNPDLEGDPTYQRLVINQPPNSLVLPVSWEDNPWFPDTLREEKDYLYSVDPDAAEHVWGGSCRSHSDAQILKGKWRVEAFEPAGHWKGPYYGADFGHVDPTTCIELWIQPPKERGRSRSQGSLMIRKEAYKVGLDLDKTRQFWQKHLGTYIVQRVVKADNSRPETISYLKRHGMRRISAAMKWPGSIEDGIAYLRQFEEIVIHPDCVHTREEAKLYSFKVDRLTGEVLPDIVDKHNHCLDAIRYALSSAIRTRKVPRSTYSGVAYSNQQ